MSSRRGRAGAEKFRWEGVSCNSVASRRSQCIGLSGFSMRVSFGLCQTRWVFDSGAKPARCDCMPHRIRIRRWNGHFRGPHSSRVKSWSSTRHSRSLSGRFALGGHRQFLFWLNTQKCSVQNASLVQFEIEGRVGRPTKSSAKDLADTWIDSEMDPAAAQEYHTAEEGAEPEEPCLEVPRHGLVQPHQEQASETEGDLTMLSMQRRIAELEVELKNRGPARVPMMPSLPSKTPPLFNSPSRPSVLLPEEMHRLQQLAGVPPPRAALAETRRKSVNFPVDLQDSALAELEKEAEETGLGELSLEAVLQLQGRILSKRSCWLSRSKTLFC